MTPHQMQRKDAKTKFRYTIWMINANDEDNNRAEKEVEKEVNNKDSGEGKETTQKDEVTPQSKGSDNAGKKRWILSEESMKALQTSANKFNVLQDNYKDEFPTIINLQK
ncbi:hypothetical protein Tco_0506269 [Tanacetum coccineum]